ncbi:MAG: hypothetical protein R3B92_00260 [Patescibacteria group bacterium]
MKQSKTQTTSYKLLKSFGGIGIFAVIVIMIFLVPYLRLQVFTGIMHLSIKNKFYSGMYKVARDAAFVPVENVKGTTYTNSFHGISFTVDKPLLRTYVLEEADNLEQWWFGTPESYIYVSVPDVSLNTFSYSAITNRNYKNINVKNALNNQGLVDNDALAEFVLYKTPKDATYNITREASILYSAIATHKAAIIGKEGIKKFNVNDLTIYEIDMLLDEEGLYDYAYYIVGENGNYKSMAIVVKNIENPREVLNSIISSIKLSAE